MYRKEHSPLPKVLGRAGNGLGPGLWWNLSFCSRELNSSDPKGLWLSVSRLLCTQFVTFLRYCVFPLCKLLD